MENPNLEILMLAVDQLEDLTDEMVFIGGCATGLLITDTAVPPIRVTKDVDAIVQVASLAAYHRLSDKLRQKGFQEDMSDGAPICRWKTESVILDVMPTDSKLLGFGNNWYVPATENAVTIQLPSGKSIKFVSSPYFLITKLEAFDGRGAGDYLMSHDIEDIIAVLDGRVEIVDEVKRSDVRLVKELAGIVEGICETATSFHIASKDKIESLSRALNISEYTALLSSNPKHEVLLKILEQLDDQFIDSCVQRISQYSVDVIEPRNKLAHAMEKKYKNNCYVLENNAKEITFRQEDFTTLRLRLLEYRDLFIQIKNNLSESITVS